MLEKPKLTRYGGAEQAKNVHRDILLDEMLEHHAVCLKNMRYVSSYRCFPSYMGAFGKMPSFFQKAVSFRHVFNELKMEERPCVDTSVYVCSYKYSNVVGCAIRTDYGNVSELLRSLECTPDLVLTVLFENQEKALEGGNACMNLIRLLLILFFEMGVHENILSIEPAKEPVAQGMDMAFLEKAIREMAGIGSKDALDHLLSTLHRL